MSIDVVMCFGAQAHPYRAAVAKAVRLVPSAAGALLVGCDVGVRDSARTLLLRVRLADRPGAAAVVERLTYWSARAHGFAVPLREDLAGASDAVADALRASDTLALAVPGDALPDVLDRALDALWPIEDGAGDAPRLDDGETCPPRTAARRASRRPTRPSPGAPTPSTSPIAMP